MLLAAIPIRKKPRLNSNLQTRHRSPVVSKANVCQPPESRYSDPKPLHHVSSGPSFALGEREGEGGCLDKKAAGPAQVIPPPPGKLRASQGGFCTIHQHRLSRLGGCVPLQKETGT